MNNQTEKERVILHVDCNAFFASVEEVFHPELKRVPMAVCGDPESRRGIILAKNELAKGYGIKTAETIWQARQKCPQLVLRPARREAYGMYCEQINAIYEEYSDRVERFSIDESFIDMTPSLHLFGGDAAELAHSIRRRIPAETGITVSVGLSFNKIFAKLGSDMKKPDAVTVITRDNYRQVVWPLPIGDLFGVGKSTARALQGMRIQTIGDLARANRDMVAKRMGKMGGHLHMLANGLDASEVRRVGEAEPPHSVGNHTTFKRDLVSHGDIQTAVTALADTVAARLRKKGMKCASLQVTIKNTDLKIITRQKQAPYPLWLAADIAKEAMEIIEASWRMGAPIRMLALTGQKLTPAEEAKEQLSFFIQPEDRTSRARREKLEQAVDGIRARYGKDVIYPGCIIRNDLGIHERPHARHHEEDEL